MLDPVVEDTTEAFGALGHLFDVDLEKHVDLRVLVDEELHFGARNFAGLALGLELETALFFLALEVFYLSGWVQLEPPFLLHEKFVLLEQVSLQEGRSLALREGETGLDWVGTHLGNLLLCEGVQLRLYVQRF